MKSKLFVLLLLGGIVPVCALRSETADSLRNGKTYPIGEVVVTGTRHETDVRHLPMTISVVGRQKIVEGFQPSLLPTLTEQIPGLFVTGRGIMGYGVSGGAAGQMTLRGVGGGPTTGLLVLIDGHPQYMGLMGHPIADAYQSMLADRVEVVRGPASVLYGSNAMGGVINIVTRRMHEDGVKTDLHAGYGSYNTLETEVANQVRAGRFTSTVTGSYNRTDGHRRNMGFEQYGGYAKLDCPSVGSLRRREPHAFQRSESGSRVGAHSRQQTAHHPRHDFVRAAQRLRKDLRSLELFL